MKTFNYKNALGLLLLAAALSTACDNEVGLLASIQEEVEQTSSKIFTDAAARDVAAFGGKYYAVTGGIYARSGSGGDWTKVPGDNFGSSDYYCTGIAVAGGALYAAIRGDSNSSTGIGIFAFNGATWALTANSADVQALYSVGGQVFAVIRNGANYELHHVAAGAINATALIASTSFIPEGAYADGEYWFSAGTNLYADSATTGSWSARTGEAIQPSGVVYRGFAASGTTLYCSTSGQNVYQRTTGGNWTAKNLSSDSDDNLSGLLVLAGGQIAVGLQQADSSANTGYYEIASGFGSAVLGDAGVLATATNYETSLADKSVLKFYWDGSSTLFACTASGGTGESCLWSNTYSGAWSGWTAE